MFSRKMLETQDPSSELTDAAQTRREWALVNSVNSLVASTDLWEGGVRGGGGLGRIECKRRLRYKKKEGREREESRERKERGREGMEERRKGCKGREKGGGSEVVDRQRKRGGKRRDRE